jgi:undecaprenyl diphosphate synthase
MGLKHLACIMDGNRRWAAKQNLAKLLGHRQGMETINLVTDFCLAKKISYLSLYTYSIENLNNRTQEEQQYLFNTLAQEAASNVDDFIRKNVRMKFIGDKKLFPKSVQPICEKLEKETAHCTALEINFLLCYGGRQEIINAAKQIALQVAQGKLNPEDITPELFENNLWTSGTPHPELIIRTGAQRRLSNFLMYQSAYSELFFLDCMWPEISYEELEKALMHYHERQKNFGK